MLSVIIPCYNGSAILRHNLPTFIQYLNTKNIEYEINIVDDGSSDAEVTKKVAEENGCLYLSNGKNKGKGAAVRKGMLQARGEFRIFTDVDIPFEFETFEKFLQYLDFKEFDVVIGDRTLPQSTYFKEIPLIRKWGSNIFSFIVGRFVAGGMFDTQCGIKGFRADVAQDLFSVGCLNGFAFDIELLYVALKRNYDIKRLPVKFRCNQGSSVKVIRHGLGMVWDLFRLKFNCICGRYRKRTAL